MLELTNFLEPPTSLSTTVLRAVTEATRDGILITDQRGVIRLFSPPAQIIFGYTEEEVLGETFDRLVPERFRADSSGYVRLFREADIGAINMSREIVGLRKEGTEIPLRVSITRFEHAGRVYSLSMIQDLTEDGWAREEIHYLSHHDVLTGLLNRKAFERRLEELLGESHRTRFQHALLFIDVDRFALVNDCCSTAAGDALLKQLAMLVQSGLPEADTLARLGGDKFGALFRHTAVDEVLACSEALLRTVRSFLFSWETQGIDISVSMGMSEFSPGVDSAQSVLSAAHLACDKAKDEGGNRLHRYSQGDQDLLRRRCEMRRVKDLRLAMDEDRLRLLAQPIVELGGTGMPSRSEVLVRMLSPRGQSIPAEDFIPVAERYRLMPAVDRWILQQLLAGRAETIRRWHSQPRASDTFLYSVNLSGQSLGDGTFLRFLIRQFEEYRIPFEAICFEVTETSAIANLAAARLTLAKLRERGCATALDDFGNGMSSFRYLKSLPLDYLKIDRHLVRDIKHDRNDCAMVGAINEVGHALGLRTIAEGAEDPETVSELERLGIDFAQGFTLGGPRPLDVVPLSRA
jgi:Amt family ammonium transporter